MSASLRIIAGLFVLAAALTAFAALGAPSAESHAGHQQKKLFEGRWHYEPNGDYDAWMTLSTSDLWINCAVQLPCHTRWIGNFSDSIDDWNSQPTTVDFAWTDGVYDDLFDINVVIEDNLGDPGLLGVGPSYDEDGFLCIGPCDVWYGIVWLSDQAHSGPYGTYNARTATTAHELGHLLQLRHESVNADESVLYECGMDDTGPIPESIMSYDCIDPPVYGGEGIYQVQPWDACGVNHTAYDPAFGYSGCDLTTTTPSATASPSPTPSPTPTPAPTASATPTPPGASPPQAPTSTPAPTASPTNTPGLMLVWGDANCSGTTDPIDSLLTLRFDAGLSVSQPAECPEMGSQVQQEGVGASSVEVWGDADCSDAIDPVDSLKLLRTDAGLPVSQAPGCPGIGEPVVVG